MVPLLYQELRRLARFYLRQERPDHTLQPTALIHEAYLRLASQHNLDWENRAQVMALAASMMRRILTSHAEARHASKRFSSGVRIELVDHSARSPKDVDFLDLERALQSLARLDQRQAQMMEMRSFAGMTIEEIASSTRVSSATVKRELRTARLWLMNQLTNKPVS